MTAVAQPIDFGRRPLADYGDLMDEGAVDRLRELAEPLRGARVLYLSTAAGGGAQELLLPLLPLLRDLELEADWRVVVGGEEFERVARSLADGMGGAETALDDAAWLAYMTDVERALGSLPGESDAVVVHGPGPIGAIALSADGAGAWVWRSELDVSRPEPETWARAQPLVESCRAVVVGVERHAPAVEGPSPAVRVIAPALDPLAPRNGELPATLSGAMLRSLGLDLTRPFCCQALRLDRWQDPHTVVDAFRIAKKELPELQLVLAATLEGEGRADWSAVGDIADYAAGLPDVHLLTSFTGVGAVELNAIERVARLALQRSLRDEAEAEVLEALWKRTPVIVAADAAPAGLREGETGYLAAGTGEMAARLVELVRDPALAIELGSRGREDVRERFLLPRRVGDELRLLADVLDGDRL